jgi:hypothetical protein
LLTLFLLVLLAACVMTHTITGHQLLLCWTGHLLLLAGLLVAM